MTIKFENNKTSTYSRVIKNYNQIGTIFKKDYLEQTTFVMGNIEFSESDLEQILSKMKGLPSEASKHG